MKKRSLKIGTYDTAFHGWTLTGWTLSAPEQKINYIEKTGGDGSWDMSTALTGGIPRYKDRTLTVTLECSKGTRADREKLISDMVNNLDGLVWPIVLPDHPEHYLTGRIHVAELQSSVAYAEVQITATCEPWLYKSHESVVEISSAGPEATEDIYNYGRKAVVPMLLVEGSIGLRYGDNEVQLGEGAYKWPSLLLTPGLNTLTYSGIGTLTLTYREAVLR